jgi:hypothetical protein
MPSRLNEKQLKELLLEVNSKQEVLDLFKNLGFSVEEVEDSYFVNISNNDLIEIIFFSSIQDFLSSAKQVSIGRYCTLGISEDFEDWIFAKAVIEDGRKLKKFKFSKTKLRETPKPIAIKKLLNFKVNDLKSFEDIFKRKDVTKDFYRKFEKLIDDLIEKIEGIESNDDKKWYASVIINRILFIYFIQHKELLGNRDKTYLSKHLKAFSRKKKNSYFKNFLRPLFFEGLAKKEKTLEVQAILENVPYLNGGLFQEHSIEKENQKITIPDSIFESIFTFLDEWNWHLDEKRDTEENEINPEVIGYIFEQLINQKQMGAYYTKEDITGYNSKNTIIPRLLDMVHEKHPELFANNPNIFQPIFDNPDAFIYESVLHGVYSDSDKKTIRELPKNITVGIKDVSKRTDWNKSADEEYALPTETWRDVVARRQRYFEINAQLKEGLGFDAKSPFTTNDLITYNLNIIEFIDYILKSSKTDIKFIKSFYEALQNISILDPTCGSGAFLFAALNILEGMYEACIERLEGKISIQELSKRKYQIYKSIILNNLYGVDIMEEAVEICKLRLFLKLISQVERNDELPNLGIEPLPDIDFNILSGNTLVGFSKMSEVEEAFNSGDNYGLAFYASEIEIIKKHAGDLEILHHKFIQYQSDTSKSPKESITTLKERIQQDSKVLNEKLNIYLAKLYGINTSKKKEFEKWETTHKPFHWIVEFYGIISKGGFDVIVGNPPYVEYSKVKREYSLLGYETLECGNLYVYVTELSMNILNHSGRMGLIVQNSIVCTKRMSHIQRLLFQNYSVYYSNYDDRPGKLFTGINHMKGTIFLTTKSAKSYNEIFSTKFYRWYDECRENIFSNLKYSKIPDEIAFTGHIPKISDSIHIDILQKIYKQKPLIVNLTKKGKVIYCHRIASYFIKATDFIPYFWNEKSGEKKSDDYKEYFVSSDEFMRSIIALLNSNIFYINWHTLHDGYHCGKLNIEEYPFEMPKKDSYIQNELIKLGTKISDSYKKNLFRRETVYKNTGKVIYDEIYPKKSKPIIDEIDRVLAKHYGFTEEELDYIINYDIKYRMGAEDNED